MHPQGSRKGAIGIPKDSKKGTMGDALKRQTEDASSNSLILIAMESVGNYRNPWETTGKLRETAGKL